MRYCMARMVLKRLWVKSKSLRITTSMTSNRKISIRMLKSLSIRMKIRHLRVNYQGLKDSIARKINKKSLSWSLIPLWDLIEWLECIQGSNLVEFSIIRMLNYQENLFTLKPTYYSVTIHQLRNKDSSMTIKLMS